MGRTKTVPGLIVLGLAGGRGAARISSGGFPKDFVQEDLGKCNLRSFLYCWEVRNNQDPRPS